MHRDTWQKAYIHAYWRTHMNINGFMHAHECMHTSRHACMIRTRIHTQKQTNIHTDWKGDAAPSTPDCLSLASTFHRPCVEVHCMIQVVFTAKHACLDDCLIVCALYHKIVSYVIRSLNTCYVRPLRMCYSAVWFHITISASRADMRAQSDLILLCVSAMRPWLHGHGSITARSALTPRDSCTQKCANNASV
jgi:hypothetical protein